MPSTSPDFDTQGEQLSEADPATGALVTAKLDAVFPHYLISYSVRMPDGASFEGNEEITGTRVGLRGLGMPAPSVFHFRRGQYSATLTGTITSELVLSLLGRTRIRAYGLLTIVDSACNAGMARVERSGETTIEVNGMDMTPAGKTVAPGAHASN